MLAIVGGAGGGALFFILGYIALAFASAALFAGGILLAYRKRLVLSGITLLASLVFAAEIYSVWSDYSAWAEIQRHKKRDFDVAVQVSPGACGVTIDGVPDQQTLILLDGRITFHIDFGDSRSLSGKCSSFHLKADGEGLQSASFGNIDVSPPDRAAFLATLPPPPEGKRYSAQGDTHTFYFRRQSPEWEWFECMRNPPPYR